MNQPLLSICIPTYNRSKYLKEALDCLSENQKSLQYDVEVLISDNHSTDETQQIIEGKIDDGLKCVYLRNEENIGPDRNFVQCFNKAKGKYIWLIGDDDYLQPHAINKVCEVLSRNEYGLVYIENSSDEFTCQMYDTVCDFLSHINIMITFMSGNIINSEVVKSVDGEKYFGSFLVQMPYFITSALLEGNNIFIKGDILKCGAASGKNGCYNFFQVFMLNYFTIWEEFVQEGAISKKDYAYIKRITFERFHLDYVFRTLIGQPSQALDMSGCNEITFRYFGGHLYLYTNLIRKFKEYYWSIFRHDVHVFRTKLIDKFNK